MDDFTAIWKNYADYNAYHILLLRRSEIPPRFETACFTKDPLPRVLIILCRRFSIVKIIKKFFKTGGEFFDFRTHIG